jgi:DNA-binding CsgD family transcriptional regulator
MHGDILSVVEAAYTETADADHWLQSVFEVAHPLLDQGSGVLAHRFSLVDGSFSSSGFLAVGDDARLIAVVQKLHRWFGGGTRDALDLLKRAYPSQPMVAWASQLGPDWRPPVDRAGESSTPGLRLAPDRDVLRMIAADPSGHGVNIFATSHRTRRLRHRSLSVWKWVAAHIATAYRLVLRRSPDAEAVLAPTGKVLHAASGLSRQQRESLSDGVRAMDKARGGLRRASPDEAVALWKALVAGRWSLVEQFDHDGRRLLVAKRNDLSVRPWHALTQHEAQTLAFAAEGQALKMIAYQLGVSIGTVSTALRRAARKVGVRSRMELIAAYRARKLTDEM